MKNRNADFLLTVMGTLLVIGTFVCVLILPIFIAFTLISAKPGGGAGLRVVLGSLGFLAGAMACASGAWAIRRTLKRLEADAERRHGGFDVVPPSE